MFNKQLMFPAIVLLILIAVNEVKSLKCWVCASVAIGGGFCQDPFESEKFTEYEKEISYKECSPSPTPEIRPVCKKLTQRINNNLVIQRSCYYEDINNLADSCAHDKTPATVRTLFCETCQGDGCNSAPSLPNMLSSGIGMIFLLTVLFRQYFLI